jgi:CheY-like chemotaxis protein
MVSQKILIVDDSKTIRMQVKDMLPVGRFEILEAKDGVEGLDLIRQEQPSLVLLDFFMPRMNGWEVIQKIRSQPKLHTIPVVMMSGRKEDVQEAVPELFNYFEFLSKPFEQRILLEAIKSAMTKAKQRQQIPAAQALPQQSHVTAAPSGSPDRSLDHSPNHSPDQIQVLTAIVQELQKQNVTLQAEVDGLKKQVSQILTFIKQRMK